MYSEMFLSHWLLSCLYLSRDINICALWMRTIARLALVQLHAGGKCGRGIGEGDNSGASGGQFLHWNLVFIDFFCDRFFSQRHFSDCTKSLCPRSDAMGEGKGKLQAYISWLCQDKNIPLTSADAAGYGSNLRQHTLGAMNSSTIYLCISTLNVPFHVPAMPRKRQRATCFSSKEETACLGLVGVCVFAET